MHSGEKPYRCPVRGCRAKFRQGTHLSAHKRSEHSNESILSNPLTRSSQDQLIDVPYITKLLQFERSMKSLAEILDEDSQIELPPITGPYSCKLKNIFLVE